MQYDILSINVLKQIQKALEKTDCERFAVAKAYILDKVGQTKSKNKLTLWGYSRLEFSGGVFFVRIQIPAYCKWTMKHPKKNRRLKVNNPRPR